MENFKKTVCIGSGPDGNVFCFIKYRNGKLSIGGVEGPYSKGDCRGSCGQIVFNEWNITEYFKGWDSHKVQEFRKVWNDWHLNNMKAGSPRQEEYLKNNPITYTYPETHYGAAVEALCAVGLNPDMEYIHNGEFYRYGHAWLKVDVPENVLEFLKNLPDSGQFLPCVWEPKD